MVVESYVHYRENSFISGQCSTPSELIRDMIRFPGVRREPSRTF